MNFKDQAIILSDFPDIKLSYETQVHKKVYDAHVILAIPDGVRHYAWFTTHGNENICWLLELTHHNKILDVKKCICSFSDKLSYGTVLYGTVFQHSTNPCFSVEDMFFYKGKDLREHNYLQKLEIMKEMFSSEMSMTTLSEKQVVFGLPFMDTNFSNVLTSIETLAYESSFIQFRYLEGSKTNQYYIMNYIKPRTQYIEKNFLQKNQSNKSNKNEKDEKDVKDVNKSKPGKRLNKATFKIVPEIQNDIYNLYTLENGSFVFYDIAYIPTYVTSVMMNKLFRNIKENQNLDALEESDSEDEFENNNADKHVFLDRSFIMNCEYNYKFKKWYPIKVADAGTEVTSSKQLVI